MLSTTHMSCSIAVHMRFSLGELPESRTDCSWFVSIDFLKGMGYKLNYAKRLANSLLGESNANGLQ